MVVTVVLRMGSRNHEKTAREAVKLRREPHAPCIEVSDEGEKGSGIPLTVTGPRCT